MIIMNNPHIDSLSEKINNSRTKEYFKEVLSSFYAGNYRSAVVMLYTCVICDLVYKLKEMKEYYNDKVSSDILESVNAKQTQNIKSPEWERQLVDEMYKKRRIIEVSEYVNIESLHNHRNLCAHPILKEESELYSPNQFTVQSHIVNMLEGVLCRPSIIYPKLFDRFITDISKVKDIISDECGLSNYITPKYLNKLNNIQIEYSFFKKLWKFVFCLDNSDANENRQVNYWALRIILQRHKSEFIRRVEQEKEYFGQCVNLENTDSVQNFVLLMNEYPRIFNLLPNEHRVSISAYIEHDATLRKVALFQVSDVKKHVFNIGYAGNSIVNYLYGFILNCYGPETARAFHIYQFGISPSFNCADYAFEKYILPHIDDLSYEELIAILSAINTNRQIYGRNQAKYTNGMIVDKIKTLNSGIDLLQYPNVQIEDNHN